MTGHRCPRATSPAKRETRSASGGVVISPGELVVADDGIVFCQPEDAPAVVEAARAILAEEEATFKRWDEGESYLEGVGLAPAKSAATSG